MGDKYTFTQVYGNWFVIAENGQYICTCPTACLVELIVAALNKAESAPQADNNRSDEIALLTEALSCMSLNWQGGDCAHARQCVSDCIAIISARRK